MAEREGRPSPEALLEAANQEGRGRLKIFLGAAPGVGKTYEMLQSRLPPGSVSAPRPADRLCSQLQRAAAISAASS